MLESIGNGLIDQAHYDDAIPVLKRCVAAKPDSAPCWYDLGVASVLLGRRHDARTCWKTTIEIGGYDALSASVVRRAKEHLEKLDDLEKTLGAEHQLAPDPSAPSEPSRKPEGSKDSATLSFGTGFFVTSEGHILTNNHVVAGCTSLSTLPDKKPLLVVARSPKPDLALLKATSPPTSVAVFRSGLAPKLGESVVAFGFPLPGVLSSSGNVSTGILSATSGLQDDVRFIQISAPVQPGNSGGPLFDSGGHVIGVVVAKLDAIQIARAIGDVPQNVNFAVHWSEVRAFLDEQGIQYRKAPSVRSLETSAIAETATHVAVEIECTQ